MTTIDELFMLDSFGPQYQADPHGMNREALARGPVARNPFGIEVLGYAEVQSVLRDRRYHSPAGLTLVAQGVTEGPLWDRVVKGILSLDGDEHARLRRLVAQSFSPRSAERLRDTMRVVMAETLDSVEGNDGFDVVELVRSYPIAVICELLGTPREDWPLFSRLTDDVFKIFQWNAVEDGPAILEAFAELDDYIDAMVEERHRNGLVEDDLMTQLIKAEDAGDRLTHEELRMLAGAVLTAGTDTTRNQLAAAVQVFCEHPEQWARLREHPELAMTAVDEVMRFRPIIFGTARQPQEDVVLAGVEIPAGTLTAVNTSAANRDPEVFEDPDTFDITRSGPAPQLTFGGGIHYCLGVHLAKAELAEALVQMSQRWPSISLAGEAPWKPVVGISGPVALPIAIG